MSNKSGLRKNAISISLITKMAMFTAIAVAFSFIPGFPIIPVVNFIRYEFSDLPVILATFAFGTLPGVVIAVLSVFISFLLGGEGGGPYGALMHAVAIATYAATAGLIYKYKRTMTGAIIALIAGILTMTAIMIPANIIITPLYTGAPKEAVIDLLLPGIIPVNLAKGAITAVLTFVSYKRIRHIMFREKPKPAQAETP